MPEIFEQFRLRVMCRGGCMHRRTGAGAGAGAVGGGKLEQDGSDQR